LRGGLLRSIRSVEKPSQGPSATRPTLAQRERDKKVCHFGQNGRFWVGKDGGIVSFKGHSDEEVEGEEAEAKDDEERAP
jgi:hypothetical protein